MVGGDYYDSSAASWDTEWYICVQGNDYDPDGNPIHITWTNDTEFGTTNWLVSDARCGGQYSVIYTADAPYGYCYEETFPYWVADTAGAETYAYVTIWACPAVT